MFFFCLHGNKCHNLVEFDTAQMFFVSISMLQPNCNTHTVGMFSFIIPIVPCEHHARFPPLFVFVLGD